MSELKIISQYLEDRKAALIESQRQKGIYASGFSAANTYVRMNESGGAMIGPAYWQQQEYGRAPGAMPPVAAIREWIRIKGQSKYGIPVEAAYAVAKKIAREGTEAYKVGGTQVISEVIDEQSVQELTSQLGRNISKTVSSDILKKWQSQ